MRDTVLQKCPLRCLSRVWTHGDGEEHYNKWEIPSDKRNPLSSDYFHLPFWDVLLLLLAKE